MDKDDDIISIGDILRNMPGKLGEINRQIEREKQEIISQRGGTAYAAYIVEHKRNGAAELDRQHEEEWSRLRIERSGLADNLDKYRFDNFIVKEDFQKRMMDMCQRFIGQDRDRWLYISGQPGCGKTHLGTAVTAHYMSKRYPTRYITFQMLTVKLRANANDANAYQELLDEYGGEYIDDRSSWSGFCLPEITGSIFAETRIYYL